jgi:nucleotide-binding universal stress UspA family protein
MAHVSRKLSNALEGALAGGGDPATSPLYVFGPFLRLIVVAGVAQITFGASIWLVVITVALVSAMYRLVMIWITDGSGGSGLSEEEFGGWAVKMNAGITFVEYTLTFLVSMAALVTFLADRFPLLNQPFLGLQYRTVVAIGLSVLTGWLVNRGPKMAARAFGPATAGVLLLLWAMVIATIVQFGLHLPQFDLKAFAPQNLRLTLGGYARILALMTGIEIFANLVAAYDGTGEQKSRKAFHSLLIIMGTTSITMLVVGPAILQLSDPTNTEVSVFTQTMDQLLPAPLAYLGTLVGVAVLLSASAASAQGLQNLALGLKARHYLPAVIGQRNRFDVADKPVWIEVGLVSLCFLLLGTNEETYLAVYAAGVFILLSMTGWAASRRLRRQMGGSFSWRGLSALAGTVVAASLTSVATLIIFEERFLEGAWTYLVLLPALYIMFTYFRRRLGDPTPLEERLGLLQSQRKYLAVVGTEYPAERRHRIENIMVTLDGSPFAEQALPAAHTLCQAYDAGLMLMSVNHGSDRRRFPRAVPEADRAQDPLGREQYMSQVAAQCASAGVLARVNVTSGSVPDEIVATAHDGDTDVLVMSTHGRSGMARLMLGSVANQVVQSATVPVLLVPAPNGQRYPVSSFKRLLVALDGTDASELSLPYARLLANRFEAELCLLSVPEDPDSPEQLANVSRYLEGVVNGLNSRELELNNEGLRTETIVAGLDPASTIVSMAEDGAADLIVMATHGRGGLDRLMIGSVADHVARSSHRPVLLVPVRPHN